MSNQCTYCKKFFCSQTVLKKHQLTAKYCLALRIDPVLNLKTYDCDYCEYSTKLKYDLSKHVKTCKFKIILEKKDQDDLRTKNLLLERELVLKQEQIDKLQIEVSKPKITNNLTFNMRQQFYQQNLQPITRVLESISDEIDRRETLVELLTKVEN
jgi:hypothetical protein